MSKEDNKEEAPEQEQEQSIWRSLGGTLLYLLVIVLLDMGDRHLCRTAHKSRRSFNGADTFRRR